MKLKIFLNNGRIVTIDDWTKSETQISGTDKFDNPVIIPLDTIKSMLPAKEEE